MAPRWAIALVVAMVAIAGCSTGEPPEPNTEETPRATPTPTETPESYPPGWDETGMTDPDRVRRIANETARSEDVRERRLAVLPSSNLDSPFVVSVLEVTIDHEAERALAVNRFYGVTEETARAVGESGLGALGDREPIGIEAEYAIADAGFVHSDPPGRAPSTQRSTDSDFATLLAQPLPILLQSDVRYLESAEFGDHRATDAGHRYEIVGVESDEWTEATGSVEVTPDGVVARLEITGTRADGYRHYAYVFEAGDLSVEPPEWA